MCALPVARIGFVVLAALGLSIVVSMALSVEADEGTRRDRVIVMNSGRILTGQMTRNAGGWLVEQPNGRVQVPIEEVKLIADNLRDAYRKQRDAIVEPTPGTHIMLAQWCISYRLHDEARDELKKCLKRDPDHEEARRLLARLDESLAAKPAPVSNGVIPWKSGDGFVVPDVESLGGLSKEAGATFTAKIQPLLLNKCGNASCHGATSDNGFKLHSIRLGTTGHRMYTERNLAEVLRYIDLSDPALSPLLAVPQGTHAGAAAIFHGPQSSEQLKSLRSFVKLVAREKQNNERELARRPTVIDKKRASAADTEEGMIVPAAATVSASRPKGTSSKLPSDSAPQELTDNDEASPLDAATNDAFDPEVFNRQFHGRVKPNK